MTNKKSVVEQAHIDGISLIEEWLSNAKMQDNKVLIETYLRMKELAIDRYEELKETFQSE